MAQDHVPPSRLWGIHMPVEVGSDPIEQSFVGIGWSVLGDLSSIAPNREAFKSHYRVSYPGEPESRVPISAGVPYRFACEMRDGDGVIYPSKSDRTVNLGIVQGPVQHVPNARIEQTANRRRVRWVAHVPREDFSQAALYEIGSAVTLFQVSNYADEFLAAFAGKTLTPPIADVDNAEAVSEQIDETTDDFILGRLKTAITPDQFEQFTADLLRAMGYRARVTKRTGDGGIDVIAHKDELGFEPPIIKVQCKQIVSGIGRPDIQRLDGAIQHGEFGLFVTLGGYSADARVYEQMKPNLRLIDGSELSALIQQYYELLPSSAKVVVPLRRTLVPGNRS
jgi:restriction system protein